MNKKTLMLLTGIVISSGVFAQKAKLNEAIKELEKSQDETRTMSKLPEESPLFLKAQANQKEALLKAKAAIDLAAADAATKDNAKTWFTKAGIYVGLQGVEGLNADKPFKEGAAAYNKAVEMDKKLASDEQVPNLLANIGFNYFNDGIQTYNNSKYQDAYQSFKDGVAFLGSDKDKRFASMPMVDTIRAQSKMFMGYTAYYADNYTDAVAMLNEAKSSPYLAGESNVYLLLAQAYEKQGNKEAQLATLKEAKQKFPNDKNIANAELNYFISSGKQEEMTAKLEEAIVKEPSNPELYVNLGIIYAGIANPPKGTAAPANAAELRTKAEAAYKKAAELAPENGSYNYQLGAFYFNQGADINGQMNNLGTSKADLAKYNVLLKERDELFAKSLPGLEKSKDLFGANEKKLNSEQRKFYWDGLNALRQVYVIQDSLDKAKAIKEKMNSLDK